MGKYADRYFALAPFHIIEKGFDPSYSRVAESVFSLGNEYMGVRGSFDEGGAVDSLRGSYFNGVYEIDDTVPKGYKGMVDKTHFMVNSADYFYLELYANEQRLDLGQSRVSEFVRELDMEQGVLTRSFCWHAQCGPIEFAFTRFISICQPNSAYQRVTISPRQDVEIRLSLQTRFDVVHAAVGKCCWQEVSRRHTPRGAGITCQTLLSRQRVLSAFELKDDQNARWQSVDGDKYTGKSATFVVKGGSTATIERRIINLAQTDPAHDQGQLERKAGELLSCQPGFDQGLASHRARWLEHWKTADVVIEGDGQSLVDQQGIRFSIFQLIQAYHGGDATHNIGAKGLTGEVYNGHAFWDTEIYCLPYYLFSNPAAARSLLEYRYHTLPPALERAKMLDCRGACYPVATLNGEEACTLWQHANLQFQTDTAIAYAIRHYALLTGDEEFLYGHGAQMLSQIARFLVSRGDYSQVTGKFGYFGVMGPDEFHMMVNNDCYINFMAKQALEYAADTLDKLRADRPEAHARLAQALELGEGESREWRRRAADMYLPYDEKTGLYEQHDGFFDLPHMDIGAIPAEQFPLYHHWSYDRIFRADMIKQPAVLLMLLLYGSKFSKQTKRLNYEYYEPRTVHESSLSPSAHSILAWELGKTQSAMDFFAYATRLDLDNYNRDTANGLHITSLAAAWNNIVYGFGGLRSDAGLVSLWPMLPPGWRGYSFYLRIKGSLVRVAVSGGGVELEVTGGPQVELEVYGRPARVGATPRFFQWEDEKT